MFENTQNTSQVPGKEKGIIIIISLLLLGGAGYFIYRDIKKKREEKEEKKDEQQTQDDAKKELEKLKKQGNNPTQSDSTFDSLANFIEQSLSGCETNQTELEVVKQIGDIVNNQADWLKLITAFGVRKIDDCGYFTGDTNYDLPTLLKDQLDTSIILIDTTIGEKKYKGYYSNTLDILKEVMKSKNINF